MLPPRASTTIAAVSRRCPQCGTEYADAIAFCGNDGAITVQIPAAGEAPDLRLGQKYGPYVLCARVADGAMGRVYEGRHAETKERIAVKVLHDDVARDKVAVERFKREFETARDIGSPFVVRVIDFGDTPDRSYYMAMEYLEGTELGALIRKEGPQSAARVLRLVAQVALGLDDAHSFGVIHRDLKPDNLFLCNGADGDDVRILDFGSVKLQMETGPKLTAFGTTLGSPYYMSPEQAMGKLDVDNRSDVFALAAIIYESLCGKIAFEGATVAQILMKIVNEMPPPLSAVRPGVPAALDDVIEKGLAKDKKKRHGSTIELVADALTAFGLATAPDRAAIEAFSKRSLADIEAALKSATPPAPKPFGASEPAAVAPHAPSAPAAPPRPAAAPRPAAPAMHAPAMSSAPESFAPPRPSSSLPLILGIGGVAVVLFAVLAIVLAMFLARG